MNIAGSRGIHEVLLPEKVEIGPNLNQSARQYMASFAKNGKLLVIHGRRSYLVFGSVYSDMDHEELEYDSPPSLDQVLEKVIELRQRNFSAVISIGGGSIIDAGKVISSRLSVPNVSLPTSLSHDGIASPRASLRSSAGPSSIAAVIPRAVFVDLAVAKNSPHRLVASGFGDTIAKKTAVLDWKLASEKGLEEYGDYSAALAQLSAEHVLRAADHIGAGTEYGLRVLAEALVSSGIAMAIAGSSRPASGSEHLFAHALQTLAPNAALHGEMCGVGTIMMSKLHGLDWESVRYSLSMVGAPTNAKELGVTPDQVVKALTIAHKMNNRYTILGEGLSVEEATRLARSTKVIP